jgi:sporulation protein YlmC with PRC-barrel domain
MRRLVASTAITLVLSIPAAWAASNANGPAIVGPTDQSPAANEPGQPTASTQQRQQSASPQLHPASEILVRAASQIVGRSLKDPQGRDAGEINSLVIDTGNGAIDFVMISSAGSFNVGSQLVAAPWLALQPPFGGNGPITTKVSVDKLEKAPRIDPRLIFELDRPEQRARFYGYYGYRYPPYYGFGYGYGDGYGNRYGLVGPMGAREGGGGSGNSVGPGEHQAKAESQQSRPNPPHTQNRLAVNHPAGVQPQNTQTGQNQQSGGSALLIAQDGAIATIEAQATTSATALKSADVYAPNGNDVGDIDEVMIDIDRGEVAYILLSRGGFLGIDQSWFALPVEALARAPYRGGYRLTVDEQALKQDPKLHANRQDLPSHVSTAQLAALYQQFKIRPYWEPGPQQSGAQSPSGGTQGSGSSQ